MIKALAGRALATAHVDPSSWSYAARYAAQSLICHALQKRHLSLPCDYSFSTSTWTQGCQIPHPRSFAGRILFGTISMTKCHTYFALQTMLPLTLVSTKQVCQSGISLDDLVGIDPQPATFKTRFKKDDHGGAPTSDKPIDLDSLAIDLDSDGELNAELSLICPDA